MIGKTRKPAETRKDAVRRQFREQAERLNPNPAIVPRDAHGRPRRKPRHANVKV